MKSKPTKINSGDIPAKKKTKNEVVDTGAFEALMQSALNELENQLDFDVEKSNSITKESKSSQNPKLRGSIHSELHISGRIDSFVFGALKDTYFEEFKKFDQLFIKEEQSNNFLESMFSLFLENNPFSNKSNLEIFNDKINLEKFKRSCPNFYNIYKTVLTNSLKKDEVVTQDEDIYLKSTIVRSTTYDHYTFLKEIMASPNFSNPLRVFSTDNFIEIYTNGEKISEGQLDQLLELKQVEYDEDFDEDDNFLCTEIQNGTKEKFSNNKFGYPGTLKPIARTEQGSIQYDGFWPNDFFKFVLGDSKELFEEALYAVISQHYQYNPNREVRVTFSNISKCIFKIGQELDYEKLMFLRCGLDEGLREYAINYSDDINLFNYIAYDGSLLAPEETIYRDKGIEIESTSSFADDDTQPVFCSLFID